MNWSEAFIPTRKDDPADAEVASHKLLLRAGYIRQLAAGLYSYLPMAQRSLTKIQRIIREEMEAIGAQEFYLPALHPSEIWIESGRWDVMGDNMFRLKDRFGRDMCLGMTHEEVFAALARNEIRSYKDLPQIWYQIQTKFRDEPRPKSGLMRTRQFTMKDSYSLDVDTKGLESAYQKHYDAYCRIYERCGVRYSIVEADSGAMGGSTSHEFMVQGDAGEDHVVTCSCGYAANLEAAESKPKAVEDPSGEEGPREVHTPDQRTIEEISAFLGVSPAIMMKSLVYMLDATLTLVLIRGDYQVSETKLASVTGAQDIRPAHPEEVREKFGAEVGFIGPLGIGDVRILADQTIRDRRNLATGANKDDYHFTGVTPGKDFQAEFVDIREVQEGDSCMKCGEPLEVFRAIEVGHIFQLGTRYSVSMKATFLDSSDKELPIVMGSYGIGVERILSAAVELYHDKDGICLPSAIAPFDVIITPIRFEGELKETAEKIYSELKKEGLAVLLDDRVERPGVKFKDADLIGVPARITVGPKGLEKGEVELYDRRARESSFCPKDKVIEKVQAILSH